MTKFQNKLLNKLSQSDLALLAPHLEPVTLERGVPLEEPNQPIDYVYFPETGVVSVVARSATDERIEAGIIGPEGVTGIAVIMANHRSPHEAHPQIAGAAQRISADNLRVAMRDSETLRQTLLRYAQVFMTQVTHTALANGRYKIEERLSRWLLMVNDRLHDDDIPLTHDFIALMLGVRRPGVTDALHELEGAGLIKSSRGVIRIVDRAGLEKSAGGAYGVPEAEYARLLG